MAVDEEVCGVAEEGSATSSVTCVGGFFTALEFAGYIWSEAEFCGEGKKRFVEGSRFSAFVCAKGVASPCVVRVGGASTPIPREGFVEVVEEGGGDMVVTR